MSEFDFPVFDTQGNMLGNLTSNQGDVPTPFHDTLTPFQNFLPTLPSSFAPSSTSAGNTITSSGGANAGAVIPSTGAPTNALGTPSNASATAQPSASGSGLTTGSIGDYFARTVIIILGFIFIAVGLNMFRPGTIAVPGLRR